ncbi:MAG: DNA mismatch repair protein MutS, partial [Alphaproteobacteria bacterium]|nr:DNA mismatch repair protein MutS [Alphaproteobacteria bacterium]
AKKQGGKSIVTRDVVRIITPGTITEDSLLDARRAIYLTALAGVGDDLALAWVDLATAQPVAQPVTPATLGAALARLEPAELLLPQKLVEQPDLYEVFAPYRDVLVPQPQSRFDSDNARRRLLSFYQVGDLAAYGAFGRAEVTALGALVDYVELTQKKERPPLLPPQRQAAHDGMAIDPATRRNLELTRTLSGERQGSLLDAIDRTMTGAGARLLAARLMTPLTDVNVITQRLDAVAFMTMQTALCDALRNALRQTPDMERALTRLALGRGGPRDLAALRDALTQANAMRTSLLAHKNLPDEMQVATSTLGLYAPLIDRLTRALAAELPLMARDGHFIAAGYAPALDELVALRDDSRRHIAALQQNYMAAADAPTLKIKHNNVIGYFIEVTPAHADKLLAKPDLFIHRQTLASAARFTTVELGELARKITEAADRALSLELQIFADLVQEVMGYLNDLRRTAAALAVLDVATGLATLAVEENYTRPQVDASTAFAITGGRHPVVEQALRRTPSVNSASGFIANDCNLADAQRLWLLTGPNMAGKSTFLRQNALIALLAQCGSFVPAVSAHIGIIDRLFSRVGASDDLARGHSTFMVEMVETAAILNQATPRSLVILDEIGRGTATYDGLSIAWATLEHLHEANRCRALFATHYHELTALTEKLPSLFPATMKIREWQNDIIFLHEVVAGAADRSYGIHVAQMAGLPPAVVQRATDILNRLESGDQNAPATTLDTLPAYDATPRTTGDIKQDALARELLQKIKTLDPDALNPRAALDCLYELKSLVKQKS